MTAVADRGIKRKEAIALFHLGQFKQTVLVGQTIVVVGAWSIEN